MSEIENNQPPIPCLAVEMRGETVWFELETNGSLLIGSGAHCKIQLEGDGVRSLHCIVALSDGVVELRDWNTGSTLHNGVAITDPVELQNGDQIRIFGYEITAILSAEAHENSETFVAEPESTEVGSTDIAAEVSFASQSMPSQIQVEFAQPEVEFVDAFPTQDQDLPSQDHVAEADADAEPTSDSSDEEPSGQEAPQVEFGPQLKPADAVSESLTQDEPEVEEQSAEPQPADSLEAQCDSSLEESEGESEDEPEVAVVAIDHPVEDEEQQAVEDEQQTVEQEEATVAVQPEPQDFVYDVIASLNDDKDQGQFDLNAPVIPTTDVEDLRAENEKLKQQLAQRELAQQELAQQAEELSPAATTDSIADEVADKVPAEEAPSAEETEADVLSREQTLSMISRMQDLVAALKSADERNRDLEEQLQNATAEQTSPEPAPGEFVPVELATQLRDQVVALQGELTNTLAEVNTLREQAASTGSSDDDTELEAVKKELADLQTEVSQERQEISQQREQLESLKTKLMEQLTKSQG